VIDIDQKSSVSVSRNEDINKNLFKRRLSKDDQPLDQIEPDFADSTNVVGLLKKTLENDEKCNIKGKI